MSIENTAQVAFTKKQGQYLAFIFYYTKINGIPPAQADFQKYFRVTPPTVHQMILLLEKNNLIKRTPNKPRSIVINLERSLIPDLD